ncbi:MAG TPA: M36 family metallopeptidase [Blastocatellia bacterium]|nr:M36 family metallopeptidase [Blastocatellia bacterium]
MRLNASPPARAAWLLFTFILMAVQWTVSRTIAARVVTVQPQADAEALPDFDVRARRAQPRRAVDVEQKKRLLNVRRAATRQATLRWNDWLDAPHHLFSLGAPLTAASSDDAATVARRFVETNQALYGIERTELDQSRVAALESEQGFTRLALEQRVGGVRVFDSEMLFVLDPARRLVAASGSFVPQLARRAPAAEPQMSAEDALRRAALLCGARLTAPITSTTERLPARARTVFASDEVDSRTEASLVYYPITRDDVRLAYQVMLYGVPSRTDAYLILIDARNGEALRRDALTLSFATPMARVFTDENPLDGDREMVMLAGDTSASPQGWVSADRTEGNNARVYFNPDLSGGNTVQLAANGTFDFPLDLTRSPLDSSDASAANLFYWVNVAHDHFYALGFNEAARNFQIDNFAKGGVAGDPVRADTLRGARVEPSSGQTVRNNAYFTPTLDGTPPLLAMLMWTNPVDGVLRDLDSSYDAGVIVHEYTHGVSTRLAGTDNTLGLRSTQGNGMGEGWSDFFAMSLLTPADRALDAPAPTGVYVTQRARGVRAYPYCTRTDVDPLTFGDIRFNPEVHAMGTVWCSMLWDLRQAFIRRYGFDAGRTAVERLVINGLKVTPLTPSFIDARDAILLADKTTNRGANQDLIWRAFAGRGLGRSATTQLATSGVGYRMAAVEAYDVPAEATAGALVINDRPDMPIVIGETVNLILSDRDLTNAAAVEVHVKNTRLGSDVPVTLRADSAGHFVATLPVLPPTTQAAPAARVTAEAGDEIIFSYANARNDAGLPEALEVRATVGRRVTVYAVNFEQDAADWTLFGNWHLTTRRAASPPQSLYFAKRKGTDESKSYTPSGSSGTAYTPAIDLQSLVKPQLEFDYYFSGTVQSPADTLTLSARNYALIGSGTTVAGEPPMALAYDLRPDDDPAFQAARIDLHFLGHQQAYLSFAFNASTADVKRKRLEGFYLDNLRVTAVTTSNQ